MREALLVWAFIREDVYWREVFISMGIYYRELSQIKLLFFSGGVYYKDVY